MTADLHLRPRLVEAAGAGWGWLAASSAAAAPADSAPDQLHCRTSQATTELAALAGLRPGLRVLDVGSGLGGAARHLAIERGVRVTGIDVSLPCVRAARVLTRAAGVDDLVTFQRGNAVAAPFASGTFDCAWLQHVLASVSDKARLFGGLSRIVSRRGVVALHEIVAPRGGRATFPLPWARSPIRSYVPGPERLRAGLESAGFALQVWKDTTPLARDWCRVLADRAACRLGESHGSVAVTHEMLDALTNFSGDLETGRLAVVMAVFAKRPHCSRNS